MCHFSMGPQLDCSWLSKCKVEHDILLSLLKNVKAKQEDTVKRSSYFNLSQAKTVL